MTRFPPSSVVFSHTRQKVTIFLPDYGNARNVYCLSAVGKYLFTNLSSVFKGMETFISMSFYTLTTDFTCIRLSSFLIPGSRNSPVYGNELL